MKKWVFISSTFIVGALIVCQLIIFSGFNKSIMESLNINFLTEMLGVIFTFFIVERLLAKQENNTKKEFIKNIIHNEYIQLLNSIGKLYITYITKNPPQTSGECSSIRDAVAKTVSKIDDYVHSNFIRSNIKVLRPVLRNQEIQVHEEMCEYQQYCVAFKNTIKNNIDNFLLKYISKLPNDVVSKLSNMNNILLGAIFTTTIENGIYIDITNASFDPEDFKKPLKELGCNLIDLYKYIN